jgi:DNA-binding response OmpR family regulator
MLSSGMANITIVATGGTRAPTQLDLAERFLRDGHDVRCIATKNALRFLSAHLARNPEKLSLFLTRFRPQLLETLAYYKKKPKSVPHVDEGKWGDVFVMCPASCNSVGKLTSGIGDNYALQVLRAVPRDKRVVVVPSMNPEMWFDPQFQRNVDLLNATEKYRVICPSRGMMLSGDMGFGAQAPFEDIVTETYRALGLVAKDLETVLATRSVPWNEESSADGETERRDVVIVDEDAELRDQLARQLQREYPEFRVHQFAQPTQALEWLRERDPALVFTELAFSGGASGRDLIDRFRRSGAASEVQIIATSARDRREAGAERLAREEVLYLPKPVNVPFAVGMIAGCLNTARRFASATKRTLEPGEVLFRAGDTGTQLYLVERGRLRVVVERDGAEVELASIGEKELVGEMAFFGDEQRTATVVAAEETELLEIDMSDAREYLSRQPVWMRVMLETLVRRVVDKDERVTVDATA